MEEDIKILEDMRDNIYGAMQFEDDYQVSELEEKQFNALNLAIKSIARNKELEKREKERKERIRFLELKILRQKEEIKHLAQNKFKVFLQELLED